nr:molybdopterin-dependent oxidoreductase [Gammaproteobacteria bacterium]
MSSVTRLEFTLNGQSIQTTVSPTARLSDVLRNQCNSKDVKVGCNAGDCGACSVLIDGEVVCACITAVGQVRGRSVETLVGLIADEPLTQKLSESFLEKGAAQCGICIPGMLVSATALLRSTAQPDQNQVQDALGGVLCRCTGYRKIIDAVVGANSAESHSASDNGISGSPLGIGIQRVDGLQKVSGTDSFGDDVAPGDALVLKVIRSPHHHAAFELGDMELFVKQNPGIVTVLTSKDIPGSNAFGVIPPFIDQPVFAEAETRFRGEAIAAIVGEAVAIAQLDTTDFPVVWSPLDAWLDVDAAQEANAALLHSDKANNVMCRGYVCKGDVDSALQNAAHQATTEIVTGFVEHAYIEPEAGYAIRRGDELSVFGCTQAPYMDRDSLALILGLNPEQVRIVPTSTGGGFGSKLDLSFQPFIALAAWTLGRAVRINYTRQESLQSSTKRHPAAMTFSAGVDHQGKLTGVRFDGTFNTGAYASWGPTVANRV